ncbi:hypothetical protein CYMTET_51940 [Cymbomonas tetramitiformis]|uniref:ABC transporter domain-containing protein n=1 Tax=Cymbomonas tetramitiformis TaxID=36881 RepID=A0AAE0BLU4_9CHLO|nr:hypothetical protein CYMTET_51940 [Cymbomonas tetramitiformis]
MNETCVEVGIWVKNWAVQASTQLVSLFAKNMVVMRRRRVSTLMRLLVTTVAIILLYVLKETAYDLDTDWMKDSAASGGELEISLTKCRSFAQNTENEKTTLSTDCTTLVFTPDDEYHTSLMRWLADRNGLQFGKDVVGMASSEAVAQQLFRKPGSIDAAAIFTRDPGDKVSEYELWFNHSIISSTSYYGGYHDRFQLGYTPVDELYGSDSPGWKIRVATRIPALQKAIGDALVAARLARAQGTALNSDSSQSSSQLGLSLRAYDEESTFLSPPPPNTVANDEAEDVEPPKVVAQFGACLVMLGVVGAGVMTMHAVTEEKRCMVLGMLRRLGLSEASYWASWMLCLMLVGLVQGLIATAVGNATGLWVFTKCSFGVHLVLLMLYDWAVTAQALCIGSFLQNARWVNFAGFLLLALTFIMELIFSSTDIAYGAFAAPYQLVYHSSTVPFGRFLVQLLPSFHYSRGFHLIMEHTSYDERKWGGEARTRDFVWDDVHTRNNATATAIAHGYSWSDCENDAECHTFQVYHSDGSVLDEDDLAEVERARVNNLTYRAFSRRYSGTSSYLHIIDDTPSLGYALEMLVMNVFLYVALAWYLGQVMSTNQGARLPPWFLLTREYWGFTSPKQYMEGDTLGQQQRLSASEQSIRMHKLSMAFEQSTALKELSLVIPRGEVLCLLGQNGAGKSTAINVLTGLLTATNGVAFVNGMDISTEVTAVRKLLGICPQDDILFEELTGEEHLWFLTAFKGLVRREAQEWAEVLEEVGLGKDRSRLARNYSGGMKRRLSFAMAMTGSPSIIFLDEPTTGLDPLNRRRVLTPSPPLPLPPPDAPSLSQLPAF